MIGTVLAPRRNAGHSARCVTLAVNIDLVDPQTMESGGYMEMITGEVIGTYPGAVYTVPAARLEGETQPESDFVTGFLFAVLLSWGNFWLSYFTSGADATVPEWLCGKMSGGYTPMVPAVGLVTAVLGGVILAVRLAINGMLQRRD